MNTIPPKTKPINVYARWRPLTPSEAVSGGITSTTATNTHSLLSLSLRRQTSAADRPWTSPSAFHAVFGPEDNNSSVYDAIVVPAIPKVLQGGNCSFFAYGHSGSGKTHTVIGYDDENTKELGLCLAAARGLFEAIDVINKEGTASELGIGFSLFELRRKSAFDLLNKRTECHIREAHGKIHIRGETESFGEFQQELAQALAYRSVGASTVHDQSSRTHAVLELEIINQQLLDAREALVDRQSELVPVGKRATDISIEEQMKSVMRTPEGGWAPNPDHRINQERIDAAEREKDRFEARVQAAEEQVDHILASTMSPCLGAKMVFVDLAGAEYHQEKGAQLQTPKQTPQERQEGRQINTDLLALKEVIRAWSKNEPRIPFRASSLTMVLREHFMTSGEGSSAMIVTVSPAQERYLATLNSLKYGSLVGAATT
ncbi:P-loop containing nucleoside triphosphate hydrolase protein [Apiospora arundinis]